MGKYTESLFVVEDDPSFSALLKHKLDKYDHYDTSWFANGRDFLQNIHLHPDIILLDYNLPDFTGLELFDKIRQNGLDSHVVMLSGQNDVNIVVDAYRKGIRNYIVKNMNSLIELEQCLLNISQSIHLRKEIEQLRDKLIDRYKYDQIVGESPALLKTLELVQKVENSNLLTLITGESGTGKELIARAIHFNSPRRRNHFVSVNLAAIPGDLVESELFGYEKGAFTGADKRRIGRFEEADAGSIFLDEIGELDLNLQAKLLRVLQENVITRLGSNREIQLNIRILVATNRNLNQKVKEGTFRQDLYYRLQGFLIHVPPLRERGNDIIILCRHFLTEICKNNHIESKTFSSEAYEKILEHTWPGNIRELKSFVERSVLISNGNIIMPDDLIFSQKV